MNVKYIRSRALAERLIRTNGAKFKMRRETGSAPDPVTGVENQSEEFQDVWMVMLPPRSAPGDQKYEAFRGADGTLDFSVLKDYLLSTEKLAWRPMPLERVMLKNEWWTIETLQTLDPDGETDIFYKGILRRV